MSDGGMVVDLMLDSTSNNGQKTSINDAREVISKWIDAMGDFEQFDGDFDFDFDTDVPAPKEFYDHKKFERAVENKIGRARTNSIRNILRTGHTAYRDAVYGVKSGGRMSGKFSNLSKGVRSAGHMARGFTGGRGGRGRR